MYQQKPKEQQKNLTLNKQYLLIKIISHFKIELFLR